MIPGIVFAWRHMYGRARFFSAVTVPVHPLTLLRFLSFFLFRSPPVTPPPTSSSFCSPPPPFSPYYTYFNSYFCVFPCVRLPFFADVICSVLRRRKVTDYNTQFSGITSKMLNGETMSGWCVQLPPPLHAQYVFSRLFAIFFHSRMIGVPASPPLPSFRLAYFCIPPALFALVLTQKLRGICAALSAMSWTSLLLILLLLFLLCYSRRGCAKIARRSSRHCFFPLPLLFLSGYSSRGCAKLARRAARNLDLRGCQHLPGRPQRGQ